MSLYQKYRPTTLQMVKGNEHIISTLDGMLSNLETCPHTFLLHGGSGCGKTTIGRIIAERVGCKGADFREIMLQMILELTELGKS
jgi:DNA polymerase-3 subunit gamma/tau